MKNGFAILFLGAFAWVGPASADVIYSGIQNIVFQAAPGMSATTTIVLAGDPASWDTLFLVTGPSSGGISVIGAAEVALASTPSDFPYITRLNFGDPFLSNPMFGSGGKILFGPASGFGDGEFYTQSLFGTFAGAAYPGWVHFNIQDAASDAPSITVIDWAYSDVGGDRLLMGGTVSAVPEPSALPSISVTILCIFGVACRRRHFAAIRCSPR